MASGSGASDGLWLVTGSAGFIGSHLVEELLASGARVRGLDNFATGRRSNLTEVEASVGAEAWARFEQVEGDVRSAEDCERAARGVEVVLHQAALGSVPRSFEDPLATLATNAEGTWNLLAASAEAGVRRFVHASSSSVYGDDPNLPKREERIGSPLSPYAESKRMAELSAEVFQRSVGLSCIGLRYFNVFGPRQDPDGPYAAVIPRWIAALVEGREVVIFGDGETSRDFCPVADVVHANLLAARTGGSDAARVFNVGLGGRTTLAELFRAIRAALVELGFDVGAVEPRHEDFRAGDVRHSLAAIDAIRSALGYAPKVDLAEGLRRTVAAFAAQAERRAGRTQTERSR